MTVVAWEQGLEEAVPDEVLRERARRAAAMMNEQVVRMPERRREVQTKEGGVGGGLYEVPVAVRVGDIVDRLREDEAEDVRVTWGRVVRALFLLVTVVEGGDDRPGRSWFPYALRSLPMFPPAGDIDPDELVVVSVLLGEPDVENSGGPT